MAVKLSNASSTDSLLANDHLELENQQCTCESPNYNDNEGTINVSNASQRTKPSAFRCTGERFIMFIAILSLAVVIVALSIYVGELHRRVDRLEMVSSSTGVLLTINDTQLNSSSDTGDGNHDLSEIYHLSVELEGVKGNVSVLENLLIQFNDSLSNSLVVFTNETASNSMMFSSFQRSLGLIEEDLGHAQAQLQNFSSLYINHLSDYDATIHDVYTIRAVVEQNISQLHNLIHQVENNHSLSMSQLYALIRQVERNHSSILGEYSRILDEAALNRSVLTHRIDNIFNLVGSQGQVINGIRSNVSTMENNLAGLCSMLNAKVQHLDNQVGRIQRNLSDQWQRLLRFDDRLYEVELYQLLRFSKDEAVHIVPLGYLLLSVSFFVSYIVLPFDTL